MTCRSGLRCGSRDIRPSSDSERAISRWDRPGWDRTARGVSTTRSECASTSGHGGRVRTDARRLFFWSWITSNNQGTNAAARAEFAFHFGPLRFRGPDYVFEHAIDYVFLEDSEISVAGQVFLQRLKF